MYHLMDFFQDIFQIVNINKKNGVFPVFLLFGFFEHDLWGFDTQ